MHHVPNRATPSERIQARSGRGLLAALALLSMLSAQNPLDIKPAPQPDPVKGWPDATPLSAEELAESRHPGHEAGRANSPIPGGSPRIQIDRVLFDQPGDGRIWARGASYKASFGADGFAYVPFFGAEAPRNFPVHFELRAVRVGGEELALQAAESTLSGNSVSIARGPVLERYDLAIDRVAQTIVVDCAWSGDVEVELQVVSELREDTERAGLQFGNDLGTVEYGAAHVVTASGLIPVSTTFVGGAIRIMVPAALRTGYRLVIDPILQSSPTSPPIPSANEYNPDIAYDATTDEYLVVWESPFSAGDSDIFSERRTGTGTQVAGSGVTLELSAQDATLPRVANLNAYDRFLTVYQMVDSAAHSRIWGRARDAGSQAVGAPFQISESFIAGNCYNADIGGDPSPAASGNQWLVVWEREFSANDFDIHGRRVNFNATFQGTTLLIENSSASVFRRPSISQSNGNGLHGSPMWLVAYDLRFNATDYDIFAAALSQSGVVVPSTAVDTSAADDEFAWVSTPATDFGGSAPLFMLGYQHLNAPAHATVRLLRPSSLGIFINEINPVDLTTLLATTGSYVRCESDGNRFAVVASIGNYLATLAFTSTQLVVHEGAQPLPGLPAYTRLVSKRSAGGPRTEYCAVDEDRSFNPYRIMVTSYSGHAPGSGVTRRTLACNGLHIDSSGRAFLGEQLNFALTNTGSDIPGFAFGAPIAASVGLCPQCPIGVDVASAIVIVGASLAVPILTTSSLVGAQFSVQGFGLGSGPCIATLHFSDALDFTVQ